jgi:hypothetical protein
LRRAAKKAAKVGKLKKAVAPVLLPAPAPLPGLPLLILTLFLEKSD